MFCKQQHNVIGARYKLGHRFRRKRCVLKLRQIIELFADHLGVCIVFVLRNVGYERMVCIQYQRLALCTEHAHIHAAAIHLHHILHSSALFGNRQNRGYLFILELFDLYLDLVVFQRFLNQLFNLFRLRV